MEQYLTSDELRALEAFAEAGGTPSMQMIRNAATACANYIKSQYTPCRILILCGTGNNSADGLVLASLLHKEYKIKVYQPILGKRNSPCSILRKEAEEAGVVFTTVANPEEFDLIVDAMYGIGFRLPLSEELKIVFQKINKSGKTIISLDIPSGVEANSGKCDPCAIQANITLTFTRKKPGLMVYPAADKAGHIILMDTGIPVPEGIHYSYTALTDLHLYPKRINNSHKGTYGTLCIFAGSVGMAGAAYLCALAAYRTGVGLVKIITPEENRIILQTMLPEAVLICYNEQNLKNGYIEKAVKDCTALIAGPGIGTSEHAMQILSLLLSVFAQKPIIFDADALNLFAKRSVKLPENIIITPHPKEFSRLSGMKVENVIESPLQNTILFAAQNSVITLLKGARTVIADPKGNVRINLTGNNGMATAGSGDVLSGIIGALLTLGLTAFDAASLGAYLHGKAGDCAFEKVGKPSLMASDIVNSIADILRKI